LIEIDSDIIYRSVFSYPIFWRLHASTCPCLYHIRTHVSIWAS